MTVIKNNKDVSLADIQATYEKLPKGNYILKYSSNRGFYLNEKENFQLPPKIYGDTSITDRWIKSLKHNTHKNMGILLSGVKGSGKTVTAQKFCIDSELPTINVTDAWDGQNFIDFITSPDLGQFVMFIDEFEKIFDTEEKQQSLLSIMDGNFNTNIVFLFTCNEKTISDFMVNRPGRIRYGKTYEDLDDSVVEDVIEDLLIDKSYKDSIYQFLEVINISTMDLLVSIINEINLFNEDALKCARHLNLRIEPSYYSITQIYEDNTRIPCGIKRMNWNNNDDDDDDYYELYRTEMPEGENNRYVVFRISEYNIETINRRVRVAKPKVFVKGQKPYVLEFIKESNKNLLVF